MKSMDHVSTRAHVAFVDACAQYAYPDYPALPCEYLGQRARDRLRSQVMSRKRAIVNDRRPPGPRRRHAWGW